MDENAPLSWIEQTLIEAWAGSSAPPAPPTSTDGVDPWYSCYTTTASTVPKPQISWQKCTISDESDVRHGCIYYYHEVSQTTQWERPNGYESPTETGFRAADDEARRQARFLSGELDEQSEAAAALNRCIELLAVRVFSVVACSYSEVSGYDHSYLLEPFFLVTVLDKPCSSPLTIIYYQWNTLSIDTRRRCCCSSSHDQGLWHWA